MQKYEKYSVYQRILQTYFLIILITFFADAFVLPEGAMLDRLLRKLPGVEYKSNSNIIIDVTTVKEVKFYDYDQATGRKLYNYHQAYLTPMYFYIFIILKQFILLIVSFLHKVCNLEPVPLHPKKIISIKLDEKNEKK